MINHTEILDFKLWERECRSIGRKLMVRRVASWIISAAAGCGLTMSCRFGAFRHYS